MNSLVLLLAFVAYAYASSVGPYDQCYREGDVVLDRYNRCKYRQCTRVVPESGYGHLELEDQECAEGTGVPYFLLQQYMHGVFAGHRFIGSHLASTVCGDKYVDKCEVGYGGYGHPGSYHGGAPHGGAYQNGFYGGYNNAHYGGPYQGPYQGPFNSVSYQRPTHRRSGYGTTTTTAAPVEEEAAASVSASEEA